MSRAYVFPGQGAQTIGMGRALAEAYPRITDPSVRHAVTRVVEALASP